MRNAYISKGGKMKRLVFLATLAALLTSSASAQAPVKIGVLTDMSGVYSPFSGSVEAAKMAVADFRGLGLGRPIQRTSADHQKKPDISDGNAHPLVCYKNGISVFVVGLS